MITVNLKVAFWHFKTRNSKQVAEDSRGRGTSSLRGFRQRSGPTRRSSCRHICLLQSTGKEEGFVATAVWECGVISSSLHEWWAERDFFFFRSSSQMSDSRVQTARQVMDDGEKQSWGVFLCLFCMWTKTRQETKRLKRGMLEKKKKSDQNNQPE